MSADGRGGVDLVRSASWSRRDVLRVAALALAARAAIVRPASAAGEGAAPAGAGSLPKIGDPKAVDLLRQMLERRAVSTRGAVANEPWLVAHLMLALGADVARDGKPLVDGMVADSLEIVTVDGKGHPRFNPKLERHPFHFLQILQVTGVPYDRRFTTPVGNFTRREIIAGSEATFDPKGDPGNEESWAVSVLTNEFPPDRDRFETARGEKVEVDRVVAAHLRDAETAHGATFASMDEGRPYGRGLVHAKACNGVHLVYGLVDAVRRGYRGEDLPARVDRLLRATIFRLGLEPRLVDATLKGDDPMVRLNRDAIKLNFLGHVVELVGHAAASGVAKLSAADLEAVSGACRALGGVVERLVDEHDLDRLRAEVPNAYSLVLGDACHALRGLRTWT